MCSIYTTACLKAIITYLFFFPQLYTDPPTDHYLKSYINVKEQRGEGKKGAELFITGSLFLICGGRCWNRVLMAAVSKATVFEQPRPTTSWKIRGTVSEVCLKLERWTSSNKNSQRAHHAGTKQLFSFLIDVLVETFQKRSPSRQAQKPWPFFW